MNTLAGSAAKLPTSLKLNPPVVDVVCRAGDAFGVRWRSSVEAKFPRDLRELQVCGRVDVIPTFANFDSPYSSLILAPSQKYSLVQMDALSAKVGKDFQMSQAPRRLV